MPLLEIHKAHWHSKGSKISRTQETQSTWYNLAFPKLVRGAIVWGFFCLFFQFLTSFKILHIQDSFREC